MFVPQPAFTANDIILRAYKELRVRGAGDSITPALANDGLFDLNAMIDRLAIEDHALYCFLQQTFPLVINKSAYKLGAGPGYDWFGTRPPNLEDRCYITDNVGNNYPLDLLTEIKWNDIGTPLVGSQIPDKIYYDPQMPNGIVNIWPYPMLAYTVTLVSRMALTSFSGLTSQYLFPPGYMEFFFTNLAVSLAGANGKVCSADLLRRASVSMASMKRQNIKNQIEPAEMEKEIQSQAKGTYNIYRDSSN